MKTEWRTQLAALYDPEEINAFAEFLNREDGFSFAGEMAFVRFLQEAGKHDIAVVDIMDGCEVEWEKNWKVQSPRIRGNPAAPGDMGIQNRISIEMFYLTFLRESSPLISIPIEVPQVPFSVITRNSVYEFGEANFRGERTVTCEQTSLDFTRCIVFFLALAKSMELHRIDGSGLLWHTTPVMAVRSLA